MDGGGRGVTSPGAPAMADPGWEFTDQLVVKEEAESADEECVKAEPSSDSEGSRGVCEAAMLAGLYTGRAVKDELVLGPERAQPSLPSSDSAGPQRQMDARGDSAGRSREPRGEELSLRECSVRLERVSHRGAAPARARGSGRGTPVTVWSDIEDEIYTPAGTEQGSHGVSDNDSLLSGRRARLARDCWVRLERCDAEATRAEHRINTDVQHATATNTYVCDTCGITYQKKNCLIRHFKVHLRKKYVKAIHTDGKTYPCEVCKKHFTHSSSLNVHKRLHTGEKPYSCKICKRAFTQTGDLKKHERVHTGIKPYTCEKCNVKFTEARGLRLHKQLHTGEKPFSCEVCKKKFARSHHLKAHKLMHSGEKPFACYVCKKEFTQLSNLKTHMVVHTGERPYPCEICKKGFTQWSHLKIHKRIHTGERPYKCDICQRSFREIGALKIHGRIHTRNHTRAKYVKTSSAESII